MSPDQTPPKRYATSLIFLLCLLLTVLLSWQVKHNLEQQAVKQFSSASDQMAMRIKERLDAQELILRGAAGLFEASHEVDRNEWRLYWESTRSELMLPGVQGYGYAQLLTPQSLKQHVTQVRREGFPSYAIKPEGVRTEYAAIIYLEPFRDRNEKAIGYDMLSEPVRRTAMMHARDTGLAALTAKVQLVQDFGDAERPGILMYVPVYRYGMPKETVEQRRRALMGWTYSPYRMNDLMQGILTDWRGQIGSLWHLSVYDGSLITPAAKLYSSIEKADPFESSIFSQQREVKFNDHQWLLVFDRAPGSAPIDYSSAWSALVGGIIISLLLYWLSRTLLTNQYRARQMADALTKDIRAKALQLQESEYRWNFALDGSNLGVWDWNISENHVFYSPRWKEILGYKVDEIGNSLAEWKSRIHHDDKEAVMQAVWACQDGTTAMYQAEYRMLAKDGRYIWVGDRGKPIVHDEEGHVVRMIGTHSDVTAEKTASLRLLALAKMHAVLSESNAAIVHCNNQKTLLDKICEIVVIQANMKMAWIGFIDEATNQVLPISAYGDGTDYLKDIDISVYADKPSGQGATGQALREQQPVWIEDFKTDTRTQPWREQAAQYGWVSSAALPLCRGGKVLGALTFYADEVGWYDLELRDLLQNMARQISFALDKFDTEALARSSQESVAMAGQRAQKIFDAAPVPMQIHDVESGQISAINQAHQVWLGYTYAEIVQQGQDADAASKIYAFLKQSMVQLHDGVTVQVPETTLQCKDGSTRQATCTAIKVEQDIIVAWIDLTEIHRNAQALRDSEQRFRNMIEHTVSGMYVWRDGRFIYVNPRMCEIMGFSAEELIGHELIEFTVDEEDNRHTQYQAWNSLDYGERNVAYIVSVRRKDGTVISLGVSATRSIWDDGLSATVVMAQDITERKRNEDQIAAYVKQLEGSMRSTLNAVSYMVELRDPYTAGHERRVGLIAAAIGREMGWDTARCEGMEMMGLVHDIGKIAVPTEILTKPGRLTVLEMEMMKCHPQSGYDILKDVEFAMPVAEAIYQHHERMDGSGYPRGLKGDEILLEARVLSVADVLESMASHRPYRPALGLDVALAEIVRGKGTIYDAEVVEATVRLVQEKGYLLPE